MPLEESQCGAGERCSALVARRLHRSVF